LVQSATLQPGTEDTINSSSGSWPNLGFTLLLQPTRRNSLAALQPHRLIPSGNLGRRQNANFSRG
jgi:hypothetical protein